MGNRLTVVGCSIARKKAFTTEDTEDVEEKQSEKN